MKAKVELIGLEFFARHGCLESERINGNTFVVDVSFSYEAADAAQKDSLEDAVDYSKVYDIVAREMAISTNLLENVAWRIRSAILSNISGVEDLSVSIAKKNPPVAGPAKWSKVTL